MAFGTDMGVRIPEFDIKVSAQKKNVYTKVSQNELALQFYKAGFFDPLAANQALACLDMMDFDRKEFVTARVAENARQFLQYPRPEPDRQETPSLGEPPATRQARERTAVMGEVT